MADKKTAKQKLEDFLHEETFLNGILAKIEAKTKVDRIYFFIGFVGTFTLWLVFGYAANLVVNILGFLYPAYCSAKAVQSSEKKDDTKWLTYWVVFSAFAIFDCFTDIILEYFPIYYLVKMLLFVWCMCDYSWNGSTLIYKRVIKPLYLRVSTTGSLGEESFRVPETYHVPEAVGEEVNTDNHSDDKKES